MSEQVGRQTFVRAFKWVALVLLALGVFGLAFVPLRGSQDEWWHLKTGQWIWQHGALPVNDIFTYTGENLRWYNHEWLSQVIFYGSYRLGEMIGGDGLLSLILLKSLIVVAAFVLVARLARQRGLGWPAACVIALVAADISRRTIYPRPPIFTYVLMATFLLLLYGWKRGTVRSQWLWVLVPLTVLWGNLHGMVLLAFVTTGAFAGGELLEGMRWWWIKSKTCPALPISRAVTQKFWMLTGLTAALVLAAMVQPSGYHLFFLGRNFTADPLLQEIILEMKPTPAPFVRMNPALPWWQWDNLVASPVGFWTFWVALAILVALFLRSRMRLPYGADYLLLGFFTYQAIMHWRLLPLFAIAAAGPAASLVLARVRRPEAEEHHLEGPVFLAVLVALVGWFNFTVAEPPPHTFFRRNLEMLSGQTTNPYDYPAPVMDYIIEADLPKRMFSDSNYCGYAIWRLAPEHYRLFTDNRFDLFGSKFIREERSVFYAANPGDQIDGETVTEGWQSILNRYGVNFLVFRPIDRPHLADALLRSDEWRMIYYYIPPGALKREWPLNGNHVWVRKTAGSAELVTRSEAIFQKQSPGQPLPAAVVQLMKAKTGAGTTAPATGASAWKVPL